jgi:hypothetical protein
MNESIQPDAGTPRDRVADAAGTDRGARRGQRARRRHVARRASSTTRPNIEASVTNPFLIEARAMLR